MLNQEKIGKFIAERRRAQDLTQKQLAEQLNVSDKAVSKWETGRSMPDNSILFELCQVLDINVNELLSGEKLSDDSYHGKAEENMMTLMKEKQSSGRINAVAGLILGVLFILGSAWMSAGNIIWYYDMPSLVLIVVLMLIAAVTILGKVNDMSMLDPHAAVAILTLLYSLVLEVLLLPVAAKLWALEKVE